MNILIAEDDRVTAQLLSSRLTKLGHRTSVAFDSMQAMMGCRREPLPDVVILDVQMPGGSGMEVLQRIRSATKTTAMPVVMLTSHAENEGAALEAGADAFLVKPPDFERLEEILNRFGAAIRPVLAPAMPAPKPEARRAPMPMTSVGRIVRNVMVVEDDRVTANMVASRLKREGFASIFAEDIPDALRVLNSFRIDAVLLDMSLPSGSGLDVIQRMKSFSRTGEIPVLVITAETDPHATQFALSAGASRCFHKPTNLDEVMVALRAAMAPPATAPREPIYV